MEKKFRALRLIGTIFKVLAWIGLIVGVLGSMAPLLMGLFKVTGRGLVVPWPGLVGGFRTFLIIFLTAIFHFLLLYASGDLIYLLLDIEENTRLTAHCLRQR